MSDISDRIALLKKEITKEQEEKNKNIEEIQKIDNSPANLYHDELAKLDDTIGKLEVQEQNHTEKLIDYNENLKKVTVEVEEKISYLEAEKQKVIDELTTEFAREIDLETIKYNSEMDEILRKWKNANIFIKIIKYPWHSKYLQQEEQCKNIFQTKIEHINSEKATLIKTNEKIAENEKTKIINGATPEINLLKLNIKKYEYELKETKKLLHKNNLSKEFILSGDIILAKELASKSEGYIAYKEYPMRNEVKKLDVLIKETAPLFSKKYQVLEDENIKYIDNVNKKGLLKDLEFLKKEYVQNEISKTSILLDDIDGKSLDEQQRTAVVTDEQNNLVIAGAGSGKTLTIAAKVKYLVTKKNINPDDILLITFTKKAANEMKERIKDDLGLNVSVKTFHGLGYELLSHFRSFRPDVYSDIEEFIKKFKTKIVPLDNELSRKILMYFGTYMTDYVDPEEFDSLGEFFCHNKSLSLDSIFCKLSKIRVKEIKEEMAEKFAKLKTKLYKKNSDKQSITIVTKKDVETVSEVLTELKNILKDTAEKVKSKDLSFSYDVDEILEDIESAIDTVNNFPGNQSKNQIESKQRLVNRIIEQCFNNNITFKNEKVKSIEELIICNFFFVNGIKYIYEGNYKFLTATNEYRQYKPDFYLPEYDIYIEHFGITEDYKCPQYDKIDELKYLEGIQWKRECHEKNGTILEETYSYQHKNGVLIDRLKEIIKKYNIKATPLAKDAVIEAIVSLNNDSEFGDFYRLLSTFLSLFNSNGYLENKIDEFIADANDNPNPFQRDKHVAFLQIFKRFYSEYTAELATLKKIDFNDMINEATAFVSTAKLPRNYQYKYIIIDEFQDISVSRFNLIDAIKKQTNAKVMAVGDDWQSIYRFAGSDISIFTKFRQYFGETEILKIEKTYRNSQQLIDVASTFITKNPDQIKKELKSDKSLEIPISLIWYQNVWEPKELDITQNSIVRKIILILQKFNPEEKKDILLLGRNGFDKDLLKGSKFFTIEEKENETLIKSQLFPNFTMKFMTIHKSKGLEADEVIILNNRNNTTGFPNKIVSDSILNYVIREEEEFLYAEERRLLYVALTRTKNHCFFMVPEEYSNFIEELSSDQGPKEYIDNIEVNRISDSAIVNCPKCKTGHLVVRTRGSNGKKFYACNNYPQCDFTINDIEAVKSKVRCSQCGGVMVKRSGKYGEFYGCKNYPLCKFTLKISEYEDLDKKLNADDDKSTEKQINQYEMEDSIDTLNTFAPKAEAEDDYFPF